MPRHTITPADAGIQAAREEHAAAMEQHTPAPEAQTAAQAMKIDVRITSTRNVYDDPTRAIATVTLSDAFVVKGVRVVKGENGLFCSMPARKLRSGEYSEVCHPITADFARQLNASVLNEYQVHLTQQMAESQRTPHIIEPDAEPDVGYAASEPELEM